MSNQEPQPDQEPQLRRRRREKKVIETPFQSVVVVGASLAGLSAMESLRKQGYTGALTAIGAEPHMPYDRPPLSKQVLEGSSPPERTALRADSAYEKLEATWLLGRAAAGLDLDRRVVTLADGEEVPWDALVLATGASVRRLPHQPDLPGVHVLRTLDDCMALAKDFESGPRVAVVGAGFIGMEVAATARKRGLHVDIIEALPVPLSHTFGPLVGSWCAEMHVDAGVNLHCGVTVDSFEGTSRLEGLKLSNGKLIECDVAVVGIGVTPATGWLEGSGLELDNGVLCDETLATKVPYVVAAGDVCRWPNRLFDGEVMRIEHWTNAIDQGEAAVKRLINGPENTPPFAPVPYVWSDQYDVRIQFFGRATADDEVHMVYGSVKDRNLVSLHSRKGRLIGALGFNCSKLVAYAPLIERKASIEEAASAVDHG